MILKQLIAPKPSIIFFFIIFCIIFALIPLIYFEINTVFRHTYLNHIILLFFAVVVPFFLSIGLNNIVYEKDIIRKESLIVGFVFILSSAGFVSAFEEWVSSLILLYIFNFLVDSYQKENPFSQFFNASLLLGSLTIYYPNLILLTLLLIISGINYSNLNWRILCTIVLGIVTNYIFYFVYIYSTDQKFSFLPQLAFSKINILSFQELHISKLIWLSLLILILIISFIEIFLWLYKKSIKSRRTFMTVIWFLIISVTTAFFSGFMYFYFTLIPITIIISNYFIYTRNRKIANILFLLFLISSLYYKSMIGFNV